MKKQKHKVCCIFDFDSTLIKLESLDEILMLASDNKNDIAIEIDKITKLGMNGDISFSNSLNMRLKIANPTKLHIKKSIQKLKKNISIGIPECIKQIANFAEIYIVSGGFTDAILPIAKILKIPQQNCFANEFIFGKNQEFFGINHKNPMSKNGGKVEVVKNIIDQNNFEKIFVIGDGYTDLEISLAIPKVIFCGFGQNIVREKVLKESKNFFYNTDDLISFIKK